MPEMTKQNKAVHLPPDKPKIRGLKFSELQPEKQQLVREIAAIVKADDQFDLQIRDGYLNLYYRGGNILKVTKLSAQSRAYFHFNDKYFKNSSTEEPNWLPAATADFQTWKVYMNELKRIMDGWFAKHPKIERELQQALCSCHKNNEKSSPWIIIDIEYAAWLHSPEKGRRLCRFDMVAIDQREIKADEPLILHLIEFKRGNGALSGASGVVSHAKDFKQFLTGQQNEKARIAFTESMQNIIREKSLLGLLPEVATDAGNNIQLKVSFLLKGCKVENKDKLEVEKLLAGHYTEPLFVDYESWIQG